MNSAPLRILTKGCSTGSTAHASYGLQIYLFIYESCETKPSKHISGCAVWRNGKSGCPSLAAIAGHALLSQSQNRPFRFFILLLLQLLCYMISLSLSHWSIFWRMALNYCEYVFPFSYSCC